MSDTITEILREFNVQLPNPFEIGKPPRVAMAEEIARLRARVEVLERVRAAAQELMDYEASGPYTPGGLCWMKWGEKFQALRATLKEATP